jgi:hypothetical protein
MYNIFKIENSLGRNMFSRLKIYNSMAEVISEGVYEFI